MGISNGLSRNVRTWAKKLIESSLGVTIRRKPPFGTDVFDAVRDLRPWSPEDVIFDVGANDGRTVFRLLEYFPHPAIYAFEPVSATFQKLASRTADLDNVHCYPYALGAERDHETIYVHEKPTMSSFSPDWSEPADTERVKINTLDHVMDEQGIDFIHFLKIDTEGHEMEVLRGARQALRSSRIGIIQVETGIDQDISPHIPFEEVRSFLAPLGYYPHGVFEQHTRRGSAPEEWEPEEARGYRPSMMKYFDALFVAASLKGMETGA